VKKLLNILEPEAPECQSDKAPENSGIRNSKEMGEDSVNFFEACSPRTPNNRRSQEKTWLIDP
jgi:hypothetical protein